MTHEEIIQKTLQHVKESLPNDSTAHDWSHCYRVWKLAKFIASKEKSDLLIVELGALLHDIADWKFHRPGEDIKRAREWLGTLDLSEEKINRVCHIIENVSFMGANVKSGMETIEGKIVQDADRLDALGAIGIARAFAYGGYKNREIYNPNVKPKLHSTKEEYKNSSGPTINHFYEKLLLLKNMMNTKTGKKLADSRHKFMKEFLERFLKEWNAKI